MSPTLVCSCQRLPGYVPSRTCAIHGVGAWCDKFGDGVLCSGDKHFWNGDADAEGDTCTCGAWYRFKDRIEGTGA